MNSKKEEKDRIIRKLKRQGLRITKQRLMLLDIILEEDCSSCKELYYKAVHQNSRIGAATVYRMINTLEEIGAISRKNMYKIESVNRE
ncbi:transcriptional repressor [Acetivibrio ethanolgignens]|uniref:Fe2+/Zn2+ uptake regulation protein n=1 Tax=Acetivibrio ethanolgignens TaxID=290052 RepID=A0A0V8QCC4_9FIRM|nr:Fe2+/Zn2+ uptake regulation protein [Acetivibrio ethanolgignens]